MADRKEVPPEVARVSAAKDSPEVPLVAQKKSKLTLRQLAILGVLCLGQFCLSSSISLHAPFFPREAEKKGATATVYGMIFGVFELTAFLASPVFGKLVVWVPPNFQIYSGLFVGGFCNILFGFLDRCPGGIPFISLAFAIRILEGLAFAGVTISNYTVVASVFEDRVATSFSLLVTFFGIGLIAGPSLGGLLFEVQGFPLPFQVMGTFLLVGSICAWIILPSSSGETKQSSDMMAFVIHPTPILNMMAMITSFMFIGFTSATLEPYVRQFNLSPSIVGLIFIIPGGIYGGSSPLWGFLCDKGVNPKLLCMFGYALQCAGLLFLGPVPFLPIQPVLWLVILSLFIGGLGLAAKVSCSFIGCLQDAKARGFPDDLTTHGMVSAVVTSSCSIGVFVGPILGGFLFDQVGFRTASVVYLALEVFFLLITLAYFIWTRRTERASGILEVAPLLKYGIKTEASEIP